MVAKGQGEFFRLITKQRDSQLKFDTAINEKKREGSRSRQEIRIIIIDRPLISSLFPFAPPRFLSILHPRAFQQRKTSRHKADRFSRLIHLVEVNKHCVPYLSSAQLMPGTLWPSLRNPPSSSSTSSSSSSSSSSSFVHSFVSSTTFETPLVLSLTRYYLCRWASQFLYIICKELDPEGRRNGRRVERISNFRDYGAALCKFRIVPRIEQRGNDCIGPQLQILFPTIRTRVL